MVILPPVKKLHTLNPAEFVDYSTEPYSFGQNPAPFFVADISSTVSRYLSFRAMEAIYQRFPLHEIIAVILSQSAYRAATPGALDFLSFTTEEALGDLIHHVDTDKLFIFYDNLSEELEWELIQKTPQYSMADDYVFYRWFDRDSVCLCREHINPVLPRHRLKL